MLRVSRNARQTARGASIPAPVKGWNARDPWDGMDEGFAVTLDNWFPQTNYVELRGGMDDHATGLGTGVVETLMSYSSGGTKKLLGCANSAIYDATSAGAVGAALGSGYTNNRWQWVNFYNYLVMVNGADTPLKYDGTSISTTTFTGLTATDLIGIHPYKNRLYLIEHNSSSAWYGDSLAIAGALTEIDLSAVTGQGGILQAIGTVTIDGGSGVDDLLCFIMDTGVVIIYQGDYPGATNWALVGIFNIGPPVGRRCLMKLGPDLIVITTDGFIPLRQFIALDRTQKNLAMSDKISGAVNKAFQAYGANYGWQALLYPKGNKAIFNVPVSVGTTYHQYVINTITGAWCRFKGWNGVSWIVHDDELYFGGTDGKVYKADTGLSDDGSNIQADGLTAYHYFGGKGVLKRFTMYRPIIGSDADLPITVGLGVDYAEDVPTFTASAIATEGAKWDVAEWDVAEWAGVVEIKKGWQTAANVGYSAAVRVRTETKSQRVRWYSSDIVFERGGFI